MPLAGIRVRSARVGWGDLRLDGTLGYDAGCCPAPACRSDLSGCLLLSAHAPSRVEIDAPEPIEVFGFLNASARFEPRNAVEFWADWNLVGEISTPASRTASLRLRAGRHVLVVTCGSPDTRHTLWALRPAKPEPPARVSVVTIAAYPEEQVPSELAVLARSARKHGVWLDVCFVGERYVSHAEMKIRRLRPIVVALDTPHVAYVDARDCFFVAGLDNIERQFAATRARILISAEAECWPVRDPVWSERFPEHPSRCRWPNAGQWMGERQALVSALAALEDLPARAVRQPQAELEWCRRNPEDDQLLWQAGWLSRVVDLKLDHDGRVFRNVSTLDTGLIENRDFDLTDGVVFRSSGERPSVLHFSGSGAGHCMHQWAGWLDAL